MKQFLLLIILSLTYSIETNHKVSIADLRNEENNVEYRGIRFILPENWALQTSIFVDTVENIKKGEFAPGIVTPKDGTFTGSDFLDHISAKKQVDFEESKISFDGIPSKVIATDSVSLGNATWYFAILKSKKHVYTFRYTYAYYGDFNGKGILINFYSQKNDPQDFILHNDLLESIQLVKQ